MGGEIIVNNMQKFISQSDTICDQCGETIPKGSMTYVDGWESMLCEDCGSEQAEEDELNQFGERYG